jgi:hypothetical protein
MLPALFLILIGVSVKFGLDIYNVSKEKTKLNEEYAEVNRINYGLFNIQLWKKKAFDLFRDKADDFTISPDVYTDVEQQLTVYLGTVYNEYIGSGKLFNEMIADAEKSGKINNFFATMIKDNIGEQIEKLDLKAKLPGIAKNLSQELKSNEPKLKEYISEGLESILFEGESAEYVDPRTNFFKSKGVASVEEYNETTLDKVESLDAELNQLVKMEYLLLLSGVVLLLLLIKVLGFIAVTSLITLISIVFLGLGVTLPMIDIDARLNAFTMPILDSNISFDEQYLYYQSKSILDVTRTLIEGKGIDLKIVGVLILMFSIVIPFIKLILSSLFMYTGIIRHNIIAQTIIFYLGKWSMADVFVVAMFMAYIGFYGIITAQLDEISRNQSGYAVETLNYSTLSPGALFFTTYCVLSIITGILIHQWHKKEG